MSDEPTPNAVTPSVVADSGSKTSPPPEKPKPKDRWDKFDIAGKFISSVLLSAAGLFLGLMTYNSAKNAQQQSLNLQRNAAELEKIALFEKFIQHLNSNDTDKHIAEEMIEQLDHPEIVIEYAMRDGDVETLKRMQVSNACQATPQTAKFCEEAVSKLDTEWHEDRRRLEGRWRDKGGTEEYVWVVRVSEPRRMSVKRILQLKPAPNPNTNMTMGEADLHKVGTHWEGTLFVGNTQFPTFTLTPLEPIPEGKSAKFRSMFSNRGFNFERAH